MTLATSRLTSFVVVLGTVVAACGTARGDGARDRAARTTLAPAATTTTVQALATPQACTRQAPAGATLRNVRFRADDVAAMTLPKSALGTRVARYATNWNNYGYMDNAEIFQMQLGPAQGCALNRYYGRITGFSRAYSGSQLVATGSHLFFSATAASGWLKGYLNGMKALTGRNGIVSTSLTSMPVLGTGAARLTLRSSGGSVVTIVAFRRGQVVGSVVDDRASGTATVIDVRAVALRLATRISDRIMLVNKRTPWPTDAVMQLSAGLPKGVLGTRYSRLVWDWFFGGCWDVAEGASQTATAALARDYRYDAARFGQLAYCRAMYEPPNHEPLSNRVERVFTGGTLYTTATGASGALAEIVREWRARAGRTIGGTSYGALTVWSPGALGDQAVGLRQRAGSLIYTRAYIRHGNFLAVAALSSASFNGMVTDVRRWAGLLDRRVTKLLSTRTF